MTEEQKLKIKIETENNAVKDLKNVVDTLENIKSTAKSSNNEFAKTFSFSSLRVGISRIKSLANTFMSSMKQSIDYIENLNLFEVAMKKNIASAHEFTSTLSEMFGMDKSEVIRYMGMFNSLAESMGNTQDNAYKVSEALTTIAYDLSSLYNISTSSAMEKLQAGLVGQTKPLRTIGIDTTYQTLQQYLDQMGLDENVKNLSQADKQLLRTIAILNQSKNAWGDMAKTIETPANQLRVFSAQVTKLGRAIGNVFMGLFSKILPYINAFVMVLYEMINAFALLVGFELPDYNSDRQFSTMSSDIDDADSSAKSLNKTLGLMPFDELNNINTKSGSGDGGYSAGAYGDVLGGEISTIMDEYNKKLETTKMKATEIRDSIMQWLGFTKVTNEKTGEISFKLGDGYTNLKKIKDVLIIIGTVIATNIIAKGLLKLLPIISLISGADLGVKLPGMVSSLVSLGSAIASIFGVVAISSLGAFAVGLGAVAVAIGLVYGAFKLWQYYAKESANATNELQGVSEQTINSIKPITDGVEDLRKKLSQISYRNLKLSEKESNKIVSAIVKLKEDSLSALDDYIKAQSEKYLYLYKTAGIITEAEYKKQLADLQKSYDDKKTIIEAENEKILTKYNEFNDKYEGLTLEENNTLQTMLEDYNKKVLEMTVSNQEDLATITKNYSDKDKKIRIDRYGEVLKSAYTNKQALLTSAKEQYEKTVQYLKDTYEESDPLYKKGLESAKQTYDDQTKKATDTYDSIYTKIVRTNKDIADYFNYDKGGILTAWDKLLGKMSKKAFDMKFEAKYEISSTGKAGGGGASGGGMAGGGIITSPMIYNGVQTGEKYKQEAIIPLQNTKIVQEFSSAIGENIVRSMSNLINSQPIENRIYIDSSQVAKSTNKRNKEYSNQFGR